MSTNSINKAIDELRKLLEFGIGNDYVKKIAASKLMVTAATWTYIDRSNLLIRNFKSIVKRASLPMETTIYHLRNTFISNKIKKVENPIVVSHYAAQRDLATTLVTYTHKAYEMISTTLAERV